MSKTKILTNTGIFIFFFLLSFPVFYFSFKYGSPDLSGQADFYSYYPMYEKLSIDNVDSPFNMRLVFPFLVNKLASLGAYYPVETCFSSSQINPKIYFNVILGQWISGTFCCFMIFQLIGLFTKNIFVQLIGGVLYLLQYGTIFWGAGGVTDGFSAMLFSVILYFFFNKSYWIYPFIALAILQREILILGIGMLSFLTMVNPIKRKLVFNKYNLIVLLFSIVSFLVYFYLRKTVFYTPKFNLQLEPTTYFTRLFEKDFSIFKYLRGSIFSQNIFLIFFVVSFTLKFLGEKMNVFKVFVLSAIFFFLHIIAASINSHVFYEVGRHFYMLSALLILYTATELERLIEVIQAKRV